MDITSTLNGKHWSAKTGISTKDNFIYEPVSNVLK